MKAKTVRGPLPLPQYIATLPDWKGYGGLHVTDGHGRILQLQNLDGRWQNPGGDVDAGEMPEQTAVREAREETGLTLTTGRLLAVLVLPPTGGWPSKFGLIFDGGALATNCPIRLDPAEHSDYRFATLAEWEPLVEEWTWLRLVACEQARADGVTRYVRLGADTAARPAPRGNAALIRAARVKLPLSGRELQVIQGLSDGLSHPEIAEKHGMSRNAERSYANRAYAKLGVHTWRQAVRAAHAAGIVTAANVHLDTR